MKKLGFIGGGNMAEALIRGMVENKLFKPQDIIVSDVSAARRRKLSRALKVTATTDNLEVLNEARAIILAIKPQQMESVLSEVASSGEAKGSRRSPAGRKKSAIEKHLFISIAAGITLARLQGVLGKQARLVRVMPNAPAMVGHGMAAMVRGGRASKTDETFALRIFRSVGDAVALKNEKLLDAVTALSGSGPAYVYLFVKSLADAATKQGLPPDLALRMALKTVEGARYTMQLSRLSPEELIRMVASPGGTTEAALSRFAAADFSAIVADAVSAAADRSRELGRGY